MKRKIIAAIATIVIVLLIGGLLFGGLLCLISVERYQHAVYWIEEGVFSKATHYVDELPFIIELYDPGFVSYVYAGEAMEDGHYEEAIELLKPLADKNYRDSVQMLEHCMEQVSQ